MSKKKKGKKKRVSDQDFNRVNRAVQSANAPTETVMTHLKRIGLDPVIDKMQLDDGEPEVYVLFKYQELVDKELEAMAKAKSARTQQNKHNASAKNPVAPIILDEIKKRMQEAMKRHPSYQSQHAADDQMGFEEVSEEEEWPIHGENPL